MASFLGQAEEGGVEGGQVAVEEVAADGEEAAALAGVGVVEGARLEAPLGDLAEAGPVARQHLPELGGGRDVAGQAAGHADDGYGRLLVGLGVAACVEVGEPGAAAASGGAVGVAVGAMPVGGAVRLAVGPADVQAAGGEVAAVTVARRAGRGTGRGVMAMGAMAVGGHSLPRGTLLLVLADCLAVI